MPKHAVDALEAKRIARRARQAARRARRKAAKAGKDLDQLTLTLQPKAPPPPPKSKLLKFPPTGLTPTAAMQRLEKLAEKNADLKMLLRCLEWLRRTWVSPASSDEYKVAHGMYMWYHQKLWKRMIKHGWKEGEETMSSWVEEIDARTEGEIAYAWRRLKEHRKLLKEAKRAKVSRGAEAHERKVRRRDERHVDGGRAQPTQRRRRR